MTKIDYFSSESLRRDLKGKTVRGGIVTGVAQVLRIAIGLATIPLMARLLAPEDFGLVAMVAVLTNFAAMFVDAGLSMATVQRDEINPRQVSNLFWIATTLGASIALLVAALSPAVSWLYDEPRLTAITLALACSYLLSGLTIQHQALLRRAMQFRRLAVADVLAQIVGQTVGIAWAWKFYEQENDYWALVLILLTTALVRLIIIWTVCPWRPSLPKRGVGTRKMVEFGANLTGFSMVNYFARNADNMLIGWWWGATPLGFYERAYKLFLAPLQLVNGPLSGVMIPALSRLANDKQKLTGTYLRVLRILLIFLVPAITAVAVTAEWWVEFILGTQWIESAPILRCLAIVGIVQPLTNTSGWLFISQGKTRAMFQLGLISSTSTVLSFMIGLPWGPVGVAAAYAISGLVFRFPVLLYFLHKHELIQLQDLAQATFHTLFLVLGIFTVNLVLVTILDTDSPAVGVLACVVVSLVSWFALLLTTQEGRALVANWVSLRKQLNL